MSITKRFMAARSEYAARQAAAEARAAEARPKLAETAEEPPTEAPAAPPEPEPEPEAPATPEPEAAAPEEAPEAPAPKPARKPRKSAPVEAPPEEQASEKVPAVEEAKPEELPVEAPTAEAVPEPERPEVPDQGELEKAILGKKNDPNFAAERSDELVKILSNPDKYYDSEVQQAQNAVKMWMGPERRSVPRAEAPAPVELSTEAPQSKFGPSEEITSTEPEASEPTQATHVTTRELSDGTIVHTQEGTSEVHALERELIARGRITEEDIPRLRRAALERAPQYRGQEYYEAALKKYLSAPAELPTEPHSLPPIGNNFRTDLSKYTDTLHHETSISRALEMMPTGGVIADQPDMYFANTSDLATGQGRNKGVHLQFDSKGIEGQVNLSKPMARAAYDQGHAEFWSKFNNQRTLQNNLKSITIDKDARADGKGEKVRFASSLAALEARGWNKKNNGDGSVTYRRPGTTELAATPERAGELEPTLATEVPSADALGKATVGLPEESHAESSTPRPGSVEQTEQRPSLTRPEYDQLEQAMTEQALGRPSQFPSYQELLDERAKPGVDEAESVRETAERLMGQERASTLEGPGTPAVGQFDPTESPLRELTKSVERVANPSDSMSDRIRNSVDVARAKGRAKDAVAAAWGNVKSAAVAINDYLRRPPEQTDYKDALKDYQGGVQKSAHEIRGFIKQFRRSVSEKSAREAMGAFIEAGEDPETLKKWVRGSTGEAKGVYENALKLTDAQKTIARNVHQFQEDRAQFAIDQGIIEHAVGNYVMHVWDRPNKFTKSMVNLVRTRMLQPNPSFAKRRIFPTTFDGEQAGFKPKSRDLGDLAAAHEYALNEAVLARAFIRSLLDGKAPDGRPLAAVSGSGSAIPKESINKDAYFINSHMKPEEIRDYRPIDHPALRSWKWATSDSDGNPIFVKGDILIHPDSWRTLNNILSGSALREWEIPGTTIRPAKSALELGREFKNTLLSLSGFHQTQEAVHALEHRVNPANLTKLDLSNNDQWNLVRGGLQVASFNQQQMFSEGVSGSGLINRIPGVGPLLQTYQDYLFSDYIPRLKMTMGLHALERNKARYGKTLSKDQIYELTANQANAAFGELNLTMLGRNKTFQDVLRLSLLAPDFLEARGRFVGQAAKPWGREQLIALALGALVLYAGARILNQLLDDDPHWDPQDAFDVVHGKKTYVLRTVQGDIEHLLTDPRSFVYNRLNPIYGRGAVEAVTGRDRYGRKRGAMDQISDLVHELVPIPAQGRLKSVPETPGQTVLTSLGVSSYPYETAAEKLAKEYAMEQLPTGERSEAQVKTSRKVGDLVQNIRSGKQTPEDLDKAFGKREISQGQYENAKRELQETALTSDVQKLGLRQTMDVYDKGTEAEKKELLPHVISKVHSLSDTDPDTRAELEPRVGKILKETGNQAFVPSKVDDELARLNYQAFKSVDSAPKQLQYQGEKYPLSPSEQAEYQIMKGRAARGVLGEMIRDPKYEALTDGERLSEIRAAVKDVDGWAASEMMSRIEKRRLGKGDEIENLPVGAPQRQQQPQGLPMEAPQ